MPVGLTASSFNSVSLQPPLVLWSLALAASTMSVFRLARTTPSMCWGRPAELANQFAARGVGQVCGRAPCTRPMGVLPDCRCAYHLECRNRSQHSEGDHVIFVGEVPHCHHQPDTARPLLYHGGRLLTQHTLSPPECGVPPGWQHQAARRHSPALFSQFPFPSPPCPNPPPLRQSANPNFDTLAMLLLLPVAGSGVCSRF